MRTLMILALLLPLGTAAAAQPKPFPQRNALATEFASTAGDVPTGLRLEEAINDAETRPLGTAENPVRADGPNGERAYLARLRCANASPPEVGASSTFGAGPFNTPITIYPLTCKDGPSFQLHMDKYFSHVESRAPAGFTIQP